MTDQNTEHAIVIAPAIVSDANDITQLIIEAAKDCRHQDFTDDGWERFTEGNRAELIQRRIEEGKCLTLCAKAAEDLVGVIAVTGDDKIDQLFIAAEYRRHGLATRLWKSVLEHRPEQPSFWLRASTLAVPFYRRQGFTAVAPRQTFKGIAFTLMEWRRDTSSSKRL